MENYKQLELYQVANQLVLQVYKATKSYPKEELFGIISQMRRAAVSIVANFVEGYARKGTKEKVQFYYMALGSLNELGYYLDLSKELGYLDTESYRVLIALRLSSTKLFSGYLRGIKNAKQI